MTEEIKYPIENKLYSGVVDARGVVICKYMEPRGVDYSENGLIYDLIKKANSHASREVEINSLRLALSKSTQALIDCEYSYGAVTKFVVSENEKLLGLK